MGSHGVSRKSRFGPKPKDASKRRKGAPATKKRGATRFRRKKRVETSPDKTPSAHVVFPKGGNKRKQLSDGEKGGGDSKRSKMEEETKIPLASMTKRDRKEMRRKQRDNYELTRDAIRLWETTRRRKIEKSNRDIQIGKLVTLISGHVKEVIFKHDLARVVQCSIQFGNDEQKKSLLKEMKDYLLDLCKSKYAKFTVKKLLKYGDRSVKDEIIESFYGHVKKLIRHSDGAGVLEYAYNDFANAEQRNALVGEFYGPQFALFKDSDVKTLGDLFTRDVAKRPYVMRHLKECLMPLLEKNVVKYSIVHKAFADFFAFAEPAARSEVIEAMREVCVQMLHTRDGSRVAMQCLWHGTTKDRKIIVKSFKTYVKKICTEEHGHMVILAVFDSVDDTVLVKKALLSEISASLDELISDPFGRKVLQYLLYPRDPRTFHPHVVAILKQGDDSPNSKKEAEMRWGELREAVSEPLLKYVSDHAEDLVRNKAGSLFLEVILDQAAGDVVSAMEAVADVIAQPFDPKSHIVCDAVGHLAVKRLIKHDCERKSPPYFSQLLLLRLRRFSVRNWIATNRGAFVTASLLESHLDVDVKSNVQKQLLAVKEKLAKQQTAGALVVKNSWGSHKYITFLSNRKKKERANVRLKRG